MNATIRFLAAALAVAGLAGGASAAETVKMATIAPGSSAYLVMTTLANLVNQKQDQLNITVDATGAATKHVIEVAEGKLDMCMTSPTVHHFLKTGTVMYQKLKEAPELAKNIGLVFWFPYGAYHALAYADSGINSLDDIKGKRVFLGPPGGGAWNASNEWVQAVTGLKVGDDYENVKASWSSALQGFQDRQFDVYFTGGIPPFPQVEQLALTSKLRILGLTKAQVDAATEGQLKPTKVLGRELDVIPAGAYGDGVVNAEDIYTLGSVVGVAARLDLDADTVYTITKTFWDALPEAQKTAPYLKKITLDYAVRDGGLALHPGALRYYKEIGIDIPDASM